MRAIGSSRREFLRGSAAAAAYSFVLVRRRQAATSTPQAAPPAQGGSLERRRFGKTDMTVAVLGFGGSEIGQEKAEPEVVSKLLNGALDAGLNVIDTAECYDDSEVLIANAIGHRRKDYFLFTKVGHYVEPPKHGIDWSKPGILRSIERSLKRLKTDAVDLVNLHSCSLDELEKGECIEALEQAKKEGKTRYIGYSGDSRAARYAVECGRFDALQTSCNLFDQECVELTLPLAQEKRMGVITKRPIGNAVWRYDQEPENDYHKEYWRRMQELQFDFLSGDARKKEGPDGPAGVALRFTAMQPGVSVLIVGTTKPGRWNQNADLVKAGPLPKETAEAIRARWKSVAKKGWVGQG